MEKKNLNISEKVSGIGKNAVRFLGKTKETIVKSVDQNDDGKFDKEDIARIADAIKETADKHQKQSDLKKLQPIFPNDIDGSDFLINKFIRVADRDKKRIESDVCQGSIGYFTNQKDVKLLNVFRDSVDVFGITFYPDVRSEFYYVDPTDRDRYIAIDDYFSYLKMARVGELQRIAQDLGAKHFKVTYVEEEESAFEKNASGTLKSVSKISGEISKQTSEKKYSKLEIAAEMECPGHEPIKPQIKYLLRDPSIKSLIDMRMDEMSPLKHQKFMIKMSNSSGLKENDAVKIDMILKSLKFSGNTTIASEAKSEARRYLEYEIDF